MSEFEFGTRVSYDDVDDKMELTLRGAMGMMQESAIIHSDQIGYSVNNTAETHVIWMLVHWRVRMVTSAKWNEEVRVKTWPRTMERARSERDFEIVGMDGRIVAVGESIWVLVSTETGRIIRIPPQVADAYSLVERKVFVEPPTTHADAPMVLAYTGKIQKRDIDSNHHVNNRVYLDYAREAIADSISVSAFREVCIHYRKQLVLGEMIQCYCCQSGDSCVINVCGEDALDLRATIEYCKV